MSFQITVLKVLAGHPGGHASLADVRRAVAILISSGPDWTDRTKRFAARAPGLDIFSQSLVLRDSEGWQITDAGRALLVAVENPAAALSIDATPEDQSVYSTSAPLPMHRIGRRQRLSAAPAHGTHSRLAMVQPPPRKLMLVFHRLPILTGNLHTGHRQ